MIEIENASTVTKRYKVDGQRDTVLPPGHKLTLFKHAPISIQQRSVVMEDNPADATEPLPRRIWPLWATTIARFAKQTDTGVGDTVQRIAAKFGGELFKSMAESLGMPCGCTTRQAEWNTRYPYTKPLDIVFVTSISPLKRHRESQTVALDSWAAANVQVVSVNTQAEIATSRKQYPQVTDWVRSDDEVTWGSGRKTQPVRRLAMVALERREPVFIVNSDIELCGNASKLLQYTPDHRVTLGIRWNYQNQHNDATQFQWGFDVIGITPEHAARLPESFRFGIGQPIWDYAAPMLMSEHYKIIHEPLFFHKNHPLNWDEKAWNEGAAMFERHFGDTITNERTPYWRQRFEPDMIYSEEQYRYVRRTDS